MMMMMSGVWGMRAAVGRTLLASSSSCGWSGSVLQRTRCRREMSSASGDDASHAVTVDVDADGFATMVLDNAENFNTFSDKVIARYVDVLTELHKTDNLRGVFLKSKGKFFSAGGNLKWMKNSINLSREENIEDAMKLSRMLYQLNTLPCPSVALVQGPAFGGGVGLVSCCDTAICLRKAFFTLSEVKLGLIPATISPYVVARIGIPQARRYMLTAENISSERAKEIGLVHEVVEDIRGLEEWEASLRESLMKVGPKSAANTKLLIDAVGNRPITDDVLLDTAERLADQRASEEGQSGLKAFFAKQPAPWTKAAQEEE